MTDESSMLDDHRAGSTPLPQGPYAAAIPEQLGEYRGRPLLVTTIGALGGRTLLLTDLPAIYVYESGGLLRQERVRTYEGFDLAREELVFSKQSTMVKGDVALRDIGRVRFEEKRYTKAVATGLLARSPNHATSLPVSVEAVLDRLGGEDDIAARIELSASLDKTSASGAAIDELLNDHEFSAHVAVHGDTLVLLKKDEPICVVPLGDHVRFNGNTVRVEARLTCAEQSTSSLTIHLPAPAVMDRLQTLLGHRQSSAAGSAADPDGSAHEPERSDPSSTEPTANIGPAVVTGHLGDGGCDHSVGQLVVDDEQLAVTVDGGSHRFAFDDGSLRIAVGASDLIVCDDRAGPIMVSEIGGELHGCLAAHDRLLTAARRTIELGPFPCRVDDRPAMVEIVDGQIVGRVAVDGRPDLSTIELPTPEWGQAIVVNSDRGVELALPSPTGVDDPVIGGALPVVAEIHRQLAIDAAPARAFAGGDGLAQTITALEGDYLLYTILGPVVEAHRLLLVDHGVHPTDEDTLATEVPEPWANALETLGLTLVDTAAQIEQHLERVLHQLPAFLTANDSNIVRPDGQPLLALKALEPRYRAALAPLRLLVGHAGAVHEPLRNALAVLGVESAPNYGAALLTGMAGAVVNPIFLISGASQAIGAKKSVSRLSAEKQGSAQRAVQRATERWNRLALQTSHDLIGPVLDGLFPLRWELSRYYAACLDSDDEAERQSVRRLLLRRLATLETFLAMPAPGSAASSRQCVVDALHRQLAAAGHAEHFTPF